MGPNIQTLAQSYLMIGSLSSKTFFGSERKLRQNLTKPEFRPYEPLSNLEILMSLVLAGSYCWRESLSTRAMSCSEDSVSHIPSQPLALIFFLLPLPQCSLSFRDAPFRAKNLAASCSQHFDQLKMRLHYKKKLIKQGLRSAIICSFI